MSGVLVLKKKPGYLFGLQLETKKPYDFRWSVNERRVYRKRRKIRVSEWAERHRIVTRGRFEGSRFSKKTVPYLAGVMDASFFGGVEEIVFCAADQTGKSFIVDTCVGYAIDRDPGAVLYVYPDEDTMLKIQLEPDSVDLLKAIRQQILDWMERSNTYQGTVVERWERQIVHREEDVEAFVQVL